MNAGARVDAWLLRNGVWVLPGALVVTAIAMGVAARWSVAAGGDGVPMSVLPHAGVDSSALAARIGSPVPPVDADRSFDRTVPMPRDGQVEVCGLGWLAATADGAPDADLAATPAISAARRQLVDSLASRGDAFVHAAVAGFAFDREPVSREPALRQLARLASTGSDPRVYALAWRSCRQAPEAGGDCALLDLAQWSRLDDGNALPWLHALEAASKRGDTGARDDALFRIASARRSDERPFAIPAAIADLAATDAAGVLAAWTLGVDAIGAASAQPAPFAAVVASCRGTALMEPGRMPTCGAIAELLVERSDSHAAFIAGIEIARQLGRDAASLDLAAREVSLGMAEATVPAYDCARLGRDLARWQGGAAIGQVAMLRQRGSVRR